MNFLQKILLVASLGVSITSNAALIQVSQGSSVLGTINSYYGTDSAADNYNYNKYPTIGPSPQTDAFHAFFYENPVDGMTANFFFTGNTVDITDNKKAGAEVVATTTSDAVVLFSDEPHEFIESTSVSDTFIGKWWYRNDLADGAALGGLEGLWSVSFTFTNYDTSFSSFFAYAADGSAVEVDPTETIVFSLVPTSGTASVNAPSVMIMFIISGLLIFGRKFKFSY